MSGKITVHGRTFADAETLLKVFETSLRRARTLHPGKSELALEAEALSLMFKGKAVPGGIKSLLPEGVQPPKKRRGPFRLR